MEREFIQLCRANNLEGVNDSLSRGVDVNTKDELGVSALMIACEYGNSAADMYDLPGWMEWFSSLRATKARRRPSIMILSLN